MKNKSKIIFLKLVNKAIYIFLFCLLISAFACVFFLNEKTKDNFSLSTNNNLISNKSFSKNSVQSPNDIFKYFNIASDDYVRPPVNFPTDTTKFIAGQFLKNYSYIGITNDAIYYLNISFSSYINVIKNDPKNPNPFAGLLQWNKISFFKIFGSNNSVGKFVKLQIDNNNDIFILFTLNPELSSGKNVDYSTILELPGSKIDFITYINNWNIIKFDGQNNFIYKYCVFYNFALSDDSQFLIFFGRDSTDSFTNLASCDIYFVKLSPSIINSWFNFLKKVPFDFENIPMLKETKNNFIQNDRYTSDDLKPWVKNAHSFDASEPDLFPYEDASDIKPANNYTSVNPILSKIIVTKNYFVLLSIPYIGIMYARYNLQYLWQTLTSSKTLFLNYYYYYLNTQNQIYNGEYRQTPWFENLSYNLSIKKKYNLPNVSPVGNISIGVSFPQDDKGIFAVSSIPPDTTDKKNNSDINDANQDAIGWISGAILFSRLNLPDSDEANFTFNFLGGQVALNQGQYSDISVGYNNQIIMSVSFTNLYNPEAKKYPYKWQWVPTGFYISSGDSLLFNQYTSDVINLNDSTATIVSINRFSYDWGSNAVIVITPTGVNYHLLTGAFTYNTGNNNSNNNGQDIIIIIPIICSLLAICIGIIFFISITRVIRSKYRLTFRKQNILKLKALEMKKKEALEYKGKTKK